MKILIDTNVILDVLMAREPHVALSASVLGLCGMKITGCIIASQTTDIFYLLRRSGKDVKASKDILGEANRQREGAGYNGRRRSKRTNL